MGKQYWFATISTVLETLKTLPGDGESKVQKADWDKLVANLPRDKDIDKTRIIRDFFYPPRGKKTKSASRSGGGTTSRRGELLVSLSNDEYKAVCDFLVEHPRTAFPDASAFFNIRKEEGGVMVQVMEHVVTWLNRRPKALYNFQRKNRPLLREDFIPELQRLTPDAEEASIQLEHKVLDFTRRRLSELLQPGPKQYLSAMPKAAAGDESAERERDRAKAAAAYAERFEWEVWMGLLNVVAEVVGPEFRPWWTMKVADEPSGHHDDEPSALTRNLCKHMERVPEVAQNPALRSKDAREELARALDGEVLKWAAKHCREGLRKQQDGVGGADTWTTATMQLVRAAEAAFSQRVDSLTRRCRHDWQPGALQEEVASPSPSSPLFVATPPDVDHDGDEDAQKATTHGDRADAKQPGPDPDRERCDEGKPQTMCITVASRREGHRERENYERGTRTSLPHAPPTQASDAGRRIPAWAQGVEAKSSSQN